MLNKSSKMFNQDFYDATMEEWDRREKAGTNPNSPDIMFDSAASVFVSNSKWQKLTKDSIEDDYRKEQNNYGNFQSSNRSGGDRKLTTKKHIEISKKLGMDPKRSKALREKYNY